MPRLTRLRVLVFALLAAAAPAIAQDAPAWHAEVERLARAALAADGLPSVQVAVGLGGEVAFQAAYGLADVENGVAATTETRYRTASISKWFTGTAAMRLAETGALDLDAPVQTDCPAYPEKPWPVTARRLLSHTAGVRHYLDADALLADATTDAERTAAERRLGLAQISAVTRTTDVVAPIARFADDPLLFEPGRGWAYTSFGYRLLGCVIQGAADRPFRDVLRTEVFEPAGIDVVEDDAWAIIPHRAALYSLGADGLRRARFRDVSENVPAGGHLATASELVRFALAFDAGRLVSPETIAVMASEPTATNDEIIPSGYGHGVDLIGAFPGSLGHNGSQAGTTTFLILLPEYHVAVAVMTNADGWRGSNDLAGDILTVLRDALLPDDAGD